MGEVWLLRSYRKSRHLWRNYEKNLNLQFTLFDFN